MGIPFPPEVMRIVTICRRVSWVNIMGLLLSKLTMNFEAWVCQVSVVQMCMIHPLYHLRLAPDCARSSVIFMIVCSDHAH